MTPEAVTVETNAAGTNGGRLSTPPLVVFEPRCKVCQSEHRAEIDAMLRVSNSQAGVRRHWNEIIGHGAFTANNISIHVRKHLHGPDPAGWMQKSLRAQRVLGDPSLTPVRPKPEDALREVLDVGLALMHARVTVPEPSDVIRAVRELKRIERDGVRETEEEMMREIKAFTTAVKKIVPEAQWATIFDEYEEIRGQG